MRQKKEFICKESGNKILFKEKKEKKKREIFCCASKHIIFLRFPPSKEKKCVKV